MSGKLGKTEINLEKLSDKDIEEEFYRRDIEYDLDLLSDYDVESEFERRGLETEYFLGNDDYDVEDVIKDLHAAYTQNNDMTKILEELFDKALGRIV